MTTASIQARARTIKTISRRAGEQRRLSLILEGFNIFNRTNVSGTLNGFFTGNPTLSGTNVTFTDPSPAFGTARTFLTERQLQLAVKFDF